MEYEYKKVKGFDQKKFVENGHTMFEEDVLQKLKRLAYLEKHIEKSYDKGFNDGLNSYNNIS